MKNPNALVTRVLRAKCFLNGDFLNAELGHSPSYTWRSIWSAHDVIARGVRLKVGNGANISVWNDNWLRDKVNLKVETPMIEGLEHLRVCDLISPNGLEWDIELLEELFLERDVKEISSIPITSHTSVDQLIWSHTTNGIYSVKTGYEVCMQGDNMTESLRVEGEWNLIWDLRVPPKVKNLLWRMARDCLPTEVKLLGKNALTPMTCDSCEGGIENCWHIFVHCPYALSCWMEANLQETVLSVADSVESFTPWLFRMLDGASVLNKGKIAMILWGIWNHHNERRWNNKDVSPTVTVRQAMELLCTWLDVQDKLLAATSTVSPVEHSTVWSPPEYPAYKCNTDAAIFHHEKTVGLGMVVRDSTGSFIMARSVRLRGLFSVKEAEALSLLEAAKWLHFLHIQTIVFEMDAKTVVDSFHAAQEDMSEYGSILSECRSIFNDNNSFELCFAKRQANQVAHSLAKAALIFASPSTWFTSPDFFSSVIATDYVGLN